MLVREVMTTADLVSCHCEDTLYDAARIMWEASCGYLPIVDDRARVVGVLTDRDVCMDAVVCGRRLREIPVATVLRDDPLSNEVWTCFPEDALERAAELMQNYRVHRLPVVDPQGRLVGIISVTDLARAALQDTASPPISPLAICEILRAVSQDETVGDL